MREQAIMDADGRPVPEPDVARWGAWMGKKDRLIRQTTLRHIETGEEILVSTVFLGIDHSFGHGPPLWFETMIFGLDDDQPQWRYETIEEAIAGHGAACRTLDPIFRPKDPTP